MSKQKFEKALQEAGRETRQVTLVASRAVNHWKPEGKGREGEGDAIVTGVRPSSHTVSLSSPQALSLYLLLTDDGFHVTDIVINLPLFALAYSPPL
jgi:hypothetical protein